MNNSGWIDISATISNGMVHWPTDPAVHIYKAQTLGKDGAEANVTAIATTAHAGTHIDAPLHFFNSGNDVAGIGLERLMGPARVIHIQSPTKISYEEIKDAGIKEGEHVLFCTRNSDLEWETMLFIEDYVYLDTDAAEYLVKMKVNSIGIDYLSLGSKENDVQIHQAVLGAAIVIIEGLKLGNVDAGTYELICLPLKIKDSDGGPARAMIRKA